VELVPGAEDADEAAGADDELDAAAVVVGAAAEELGAGAEVVIDPVAAA